MADFGETIDLIENIRSILHRYPFSVGIFRELLQNSDDAKATKQVFLLDHRTHRTSNLVNDNLGVLQGPALLAYNNAIFSESDWKALQTISRSSKKFDTSKIGKYGLGIRATYHITDNLQVLSGNDLVIFDPQRDLLEDGGSRWKLAELDEKFPDQLEPFRRFLSLGPSRSVLDGTVIRLPLRTSSAKSSISPEVLHPGRIRELLLMFIKEELKIALLFLSNVTSIEVREIDDEGERLLGKAEITREAPVVFGAGEDQMHPMTCTHVVKLSEGIFTQPESQMWRVIRASFPRERCVEVVTAALGYDDNYDVFAVLDKEKLSPELSLAIPLPLEPTSNGRLFTYLPLPLFTGFPCHVHALFALTDSRDHLRNGTEVGVLDHTRDNLLVVWNRVLFEKFIPRVWTTLLEVLVGLDKVEDIYQAWPPAQHTTAGQESVPWQCMPKRIIHNANECNSSIWPVVQSSLHERLDALLLAPSQAEDVLLGALATAGVRIVQPPAYIYALLLDVGWEAMLTPRSAHSAILDGGVDLSAVSRESKNIILSYLVTSSPDPDLTLLAKLSLFPRVSGSDAVLYLRSDQSPMTHTLLNREDEVVFGVDDPMAIALRELPSPVSKQLLDRGEAVLNVNLLTPSRVVDYLRAAFFRHGSALDLPSPALPTFSKWLFTWWTWFTSWPQADGLFPFVKAFALLPTSLDGLHILQDGIYVKAVNFDATLQDIFERSGIDFLHPSFPMSVLPYLRQHSLAKNPCHALDLLQDLRPQTVRLLADADIRKLGEHLSRCLSEIGHLKQERMQQLRSLPIFPLLEPLENLAEYSVSRKLDALPLGSTILAVANECASLLPVIPEIMFVVNDDYGCALLEHVDSKVAAHVLYKTDVILLAIANFTTQTPSLRLAFLKILVDNPVLRSRDIDMKLQETSFIAVDGEQSLFAPGDVIDPQSELAQLLCPDDRRPAEDDLNIEILSVLRTLGLLRTDMTSTFVQERISRIAELRLSSEPDASEIARRLLDLLTQSSFDYNALVIPPDTVWLPTNRGMFAAQACRDQRDCYLFDRILPVIESHINDSLRHALGWDQRITTEVLKQQLEAIILEESSAEQWKVLHSIICEFGRRLRELELPTIEAVRQLTADRPWIPISSTHVATTLQVVFSLNTTLDGFYQVPLDLLSHSGVKEFLASMGCTDSPSVPALLRRLRTLQDVQPTAVSVRQSIQILNAIQVQSLTSDYLDQVLVPDIDGNLRKREDVYFDDLGGRALELPEDRSKLHTEASHHIVWLGIQSLTSLHLKQFDDDDEDMSEDLTTRISNVLRSYSIEQAPNEFLANAADAGATKFEIVLDEKHFQTTGLKFLTPEMAQSCTGPALVIYNDRVFTNIDFKGIRHIGLGGKQDRTGVIGKFGLGALSMFHFTEFAMIVSGRDVLFLDPGTLYLPVNGDRKRNSLRIPLRKLRSAYDGHLALLDGLFGFAADVDHYDGTLFRLPLRTKKQAKTSQLSRIARSVADVRRMLLRYQEDLGPQSLIFVDVNDIAVSRRDSQGECTPSWSCSVVRQDLHQEGSYSCRKLTVTCVSERSRIPSLAELYTVSGSLAIQDLPSMDTELLAKHRLKDVRIGLAALSADHSNESAKHRFFSTLPLPTFTTLPVHVNATFALADDRRSIRFDDSGQSTAESKYNHYILSGLIPMLYFYLLERWPAGFNNVGAWPGKAEDLLSQAISKSFYKSLASTPRQICHSMTAHRLRPNDAVFGREDAVLTVLLTLKPPSLTLLPSRVSEMVADAQIRSIDVEFVRTSLEHDQAHFVSLYGVDSVDGAIALEDVVELLRFFLPHSPQRLVGLPVLPLADGSLGMVESSPSRMVYTGGWSSDRKPWPLFPSNRFLHPGMDPHLLLDQSLNVAQLAGSAVVELVAECLPKSQVANRNYTPAEQEWINAFWSYFPHLSIDANDVASLALIPTTEANRYISIDHWNTDAVFTYQPRNWDELKWLPPCLQCLGAIVVRRDSSYPESLRKQLKSTASMFNQTLNFFRRVDTAPGALPKLWRRLKSSSTFAEWMRREVEANLAFLAEGQLISVVSHLPIWPAHRTGSTELRAAGDGDIKILPSSIQFERVGRFLEPGCLFAEIPSEVLTLLKVDPMSISDFVRCLKLPKSLLLRELPIYGWIFNQVLTCAPRHQQVRNAQLKVPDASLRLREPNKLYARSEPMFLAAFGDTPKSEHFLHPSFSEWETYLVDHGLHGKRDFATFKECVTYFSMDRTRTTRRAVQLFDWYIQLPAQIGSQAHLWQELAGIRFIPRHTSRRRYNNTEIQLTDYPDAVSLPVLITPAEVLRSEHERIAWTQRGLFLKDPDSRLFLVDQTLGVPSIEEVISHLLILATQIAPDHLSNPEVLEDLLATYQWLDQRGEDAEELLMRYRDDPLFLNIDSDSQPWHFTCASLLFLNSHDEGDHESVRQLLGPFRRLLVSAGATEIIQPPAPKIVFSPAERVFTDWRTSMNKQRNGRILTDVVFITAEDEEFHAHRNLLAASSEHFQELFLGSFAEAGPATAADPIRLQVDDPSVAVQAILDHVYTGKFNPPNPDDQEELLSILELSHRWQFTDLHAEIQGELVRTISPLTYGTLRWKAVIFEAAVLLEACEQFERDNYQVLRRL